MPRQPRILIVDDDPALLAALPETVRTRLEGVTVEACADAKTALELIALHDYDAVVSDIKMPEMDGLELLARVKLIRPEVPILLITGHGEHDLAVRALRGGAYDFIQKPVERDYFIASLVRAIQSRQMRQQIEQQKAALARHAAELEQIVHTRTQELMEANRLKDEFLATLSHELRTPLTAILGWAQMLRSGRLDEDTAARAVSSIERNAKFQSHLIEDLLDISRIVTGKLRLEVHPMELPPIIEAALDAVRPAADAKGIQLIKDLEEHAGLVSGDPTRLQQVVWNLLSNAIKFTPRGGEVRVALARTDGHVGITVTDTGQGIPATFLPYIFDVFRQADSTITRKHGGLGLGLAIVRHVVEMHGGSVQAESEGDGRGATFLVRLPVAAPAEDDGAALDGNGRPAAHESPHLAGVQVLVVDDEPDTRDLVVMVLSRCGAEVRASASARDALALLQQWRPDVLVSDIGMPDGDGYDLIRRIRAMESEGARLPAVALTAYARPEDRLRALNAGFQVHVPKPVEPVELTAVVASLTIHKLRTHA